MPKIAHFDFGSEPSNFGDSASVQCLITSGDGPLEFEWLFNGKPVSYIAGITTAKMGKRNTVLTIDSVTEKHVGNFTCRATNNAATVNFTAELIVNGTETERITSIANNSSIFSYSLSLMLCLFFSLCNHISVLFSPFETIWSWFVAQEMRANEINELVG